MFYNRRFSSQVISKPDLHLTFSSNSVFVPDQVPHYTGIAVNARIWNTGLPSLVTNWAMKIIPNGADAVIAQLTNMPNVLSLNGIYNSTKLLAKNSLVEKTNDDQIGITPVSGDLLFYVALPQNVVMAADTVWEVTVKDIYEKETSVSHLVGDWLQR